MNTHTPAYQYQLAHINEDKGPRTIAASITLMGITSLAVALRLTAQRMVKSSFTGDDYCAVLALGSSPPIENYLVTSLTSPYRSLHLLFALISLLVGALYP